MIQIERSTEMQHNREQRKEKLTIESQGIEEAQKKYIEGSAGIKEDASQENPDPKYEKEHKVRKREVMEKHEEGKAGRNTESETGRNLDGPIGVSLLVGFLFMFVIDQLAKMSHSRNKTLSTLGLVIHAFGNYCKLFIPVIGNNYLFSKPMGLQWEVHQVQANNWKCKCSFLSP
jgi:hypothetical protein